MFDLTKAMKLFLQIVTSPLAKNILLLELEKMGLTYTLAELEEHDVCELGPAEKYALQNRVIQRSWDAAHPEDRFVLVDRIKLLIFEAVHSERVCNSKFSVYLSKKLHHNYTYLSNVFSHGNGCKLKQYIIQQKIARAKMLLLEERYTLSEISWKLQYSSVAHLSNQFKKIAGCTPSEFKRIEADRVSSPMRVRSGHYEYRGTGK